MASLRTTPDARIPEDLTRMPWPLEGWPEAANLAAGQAEAHARRLGGEPDRYVCIEADGCHKVYPAWFWTK